MNTVAGTFVVDRRRAVRRPRHRPVPGRRRSASEPVVDGTKVVVGVRPEHLLIGDGPIEARGASRSSGSATSATSSATSTARTIIVREPSSAGARTDGEIVRLTAEPDEVHLFDPDTTERIN